MLKNLLEDSWYLKVISELDNKNLKGPKFEKHELDDDGLLQFHEMMYIHDSGELQNTILKTHRVLYCVHPSVKKMYVDTNKLIC